MASIDKFEKKGLKHLAKIESELEDIKDRTGDPKRMFINGMLYGAGAFLGGILAIMMLGWLLSLGGLIPGFAEIADTVNDAIQTRAR